MDKTTVQKSTKYTEIHYVHVLPVLWMTSCFHTMGSMARVDPTKDY